MVGGDGEEREDRDERDRDEGGEAAGDGAGDGAGAGAGSTRDVRESRGLANRASKPGSQDGSALDGQGLDDPLRGFKVAQGVDDGQVDLNLWPDHCVSFAEFIHNITPRHHGRFRGRLDGDRLHRAPGGFACALSVLWGGQS
jgi:hypothetical protein